MKIEELWVPSTNREPDDENFYQAAKLISIGKKVIFDNGQPIGEEMTGLVILVEREGRVHEVVMNDTYVKKMTDDKNKQSAVSFDRPRVKFAEE